MHGTSATIHLLAVFHRAFGQLNDLLITKALKEEAWGPKYAFSVFVVEVIHTSGENA